MKTITTLLVTLLAFAQLPALAESRDESFNVATISCWEVGGLETEDRVAALMLIYGYVAGRNDLNLQRGSTIQSAVTRVQTLCESNPDMYVLSAFERQVTE